MAVDFTPTLGNYTELKPFRYWCQKVLPLVYDDSLSYYELLCKVVDYLNKTMEDVETLHDDVEDLHTAYEQLQEYVNNYFDNLDVQQEIDNKLDALVDDGTFTRLFAPTILANITPLAVSSTDDMSNHSKLYVLTSNGHVYQWSSSLSQFADTGLVYGTIGNYLSTKNVISEGDLNDVAPNTVIAISYTEGAFDNLPSNHAGYLVTYQFANSANAKVQLFYRYDKPVTWIRYCNLDGDWTKWVSQTALQDGGLVGNTDTTYPYYNLRDLNNAPSNTFLSLNALSAGSENPYLHTPNDYQTAGYVMTYRWGGSSARLQFYYRYNNGKGFYRVCNIDSEWSNWEAITGSTTYTTNQTINQNSYTNTYNITATPNITTDTHGWLTSTGDTTDRSGDILTLLNTTGYCHLGEGNFYVANPIEIPENGTLIGCGLKTTLRLQSGYAGALVIPTSNCVVKDMRLQGNGNPSSTIGNEVGVLIYDTQSASSSVSTHEHSNNRIDGLSFAYFNGSGIEIRGTGNSSNAGAIITNCRVLRCSVGINLGVYAEYNKIDTCIIGNNNYIGVINNGGNNVFVNCNISGSNTGFLIDNSSGTLVNDGHGACIGCVFNHVGGNGDSIRILGLNNSFMFSGCEWWYGTIRLNASKGVTFNGLNGCGNNCSIIIQNCTGILFNAMQLDKTPTITTSSNQYLRFVNCYNYATGAAIGS